MKSIRLNDRLNKLRCLEENEKMYESQLSDSRIGQTMIDNGIIFQDSEFRRNILSVQKNQVFIMNIFEFGIGVDVQNSGCSTQIETEML